MSSCRHAHVLSINYRLSAALQAGSRLQARMKRFNLPSAPIRRISKLSISSTMDDSQFVSLTRHVKPIDGMDDSYFANWKDVTLGRPPFDGVAYYYDSNSVIGSVLPKSRQDNLRFTLGLGRPGKVDEADLKRAFDHLKRTVVIR